MALTFKTVPETASEKKPVMISILGHDFPFKEPTRKLAGPMIGAGLEIMVKHGISFDSTTSDVEQSVGVFKGLPEIIDFVADCLDMSGDDRSVFDVDYDIAETGIAFAEIIKHLQRPFAGGSSNTGGTPKTGQTP